MNLKCENINELIRSYFYLQRENEGLKSEIRNLETIAKLQDETIKMFKELIGDKQ